MFGTTSSSGAADGSLRGRSMRCITMADGTPLRCDRAWETFTGVDTTTLHNAGWSLLLHPSDIALLDDARRESVRTALPFEVDARVRGADGAYRWCQLSGVRARERERANAGEDAHGGDDRVSAPDDERWIIRMVDVDRHKRVQERLEHALQSREQSLATFAHDLRNPVQTMRHALFALTLEGGSPESRPQMLSVLERQIEVITRKTHEYLQELQRERLA